VTSSLSSNNKKKRILIVDDEPDMTSLLRIAIERAGFSVDTFNDPSIAVQHFQPDSYDIVLLDIIMPKMDGFELYKQIKKVDPLVKVCFLTASEMHREEFRKEKHCDLDKDLFLKRPMPIKEIIGEIN
jgi:DNA-binding response OmpR family regulator